VKISEHEGNPAWMLVRSGGASQDAWMPKPGISKLNFKPALYQMLDAKEPQFLAYAPADVTTPTDSEQLNSMTATFGAGMGTFQWRERPYSFVVVKNCRASSDKIKTRRSWRVSIVGLAFGFVLLTILTLAKFINSPYAQPMDGNGNSSGPHPEPASWADDALTIANLGHAGGA